MTALDEITGLLSVLSQRGASISLITHRGFLAWVADCASQICGGCVIASSAPREVVARYRRRRCDGEICARD